MDSLDHRIPGTECEDKIHQAITLALGHKYFSIWGTLFLGDTQPEVLSAAAMTLPFKEGK